MAHEVWIRDLEARVNALERDVRGLRRELSDVILNPLLKEVGELKTLVQRRPGAPGEAAVGEDRHLTLRDFLVASGAVGATVTVLKLLHLLN